MNRVFIGQGGNCAGLHVWISEYTRLFNFGALGDNLQGDYFVAFWLNLFWVGIRFAWWSKKPPKSWDWRLFQPK